jgi:hypothetical protein
MGAMQWAQQSTARRAQQRAHIPDHTSRGRVAFKPRDPHHGVRVHRTATVIQALQPASNVGIAVVKIQIEVIVCVVMASIDVHQALTYVPAPELLFEIFKLNAPCSSRGVTVVVCIVLADLDQEGCVVQGPH